MAPGTKTRTQFYGDDRTTWVVWGGQIRFTIKGQEPFVAKKGFLVQVPLRVPYSMEVVGDEPGLRFEVTRGGGILPSYPVENRADFGAAPPPKNGQHYVKVSYPTQPVGGGMGTYDAVNKPYLDFEKDVVAGGRKGGGFVKDDHTWANVIRQPGIPTPPDSNFGHFHENFAEFWVVLEGQLDFLIQGVPLIKAE